MCSDYGSTQFFDRESFNLPPKKGSFLRITLKITFVYLTTRHSKTFSLAAFKFVGSTI